jgi:hypothetical protein
MARASSDQVNNLTLMNHDKLLADRVLSPTGRRNHKTRGLSTCETSSVEGTRIRRKSEPVKSACVQCQKRKTKCSGHRPSCRSCTDRGIGCSWNIEEGLTRTAGLKKQLREAVGRSEDLCVLVDAMRRGTDEVSSMLLAKLRIGMALDDLLTGIGRESFLINHNISEAQKKAIYAHWSSFQVCSSFSISKDSGKTQCAGFCRLEGVYLRSFVQSNV